MYTLTAYIMEGLHSKEIMEHFLSIFSIVLFLNRWKKNNLCPGIICHVDRPIRCMSEGSRL